MSSRASEALRSSRTAPVSSLRVPSFVCHAGILRITVLSDPGRMPDVAVLTAALRQELGSAAR